GSGRCRDSQRGRCAGPGPLIEGTGAAKVACRVMPADPPPRSGKSGAGWPAVSVVMPVLDEERHLREAVRGVLDQEYPGELELVMALGPSTDRTDEIAAELVAANPRVRSVRNPAGTTPAALNAAVGAARH